MEAIKRIQREEAAKAYGAASRARLVDELLDCEAIFALAELRALAEAEEMTYRRPAAMACA